MRLAGVSRALRQVLLSGTAGTCDRSAEWIEARRDSMIVIACRKVELRPTYRTASLLWPRSGNNGAPSRSARSKHAEAASMQRQQACRGSKHAEAASMQRVSVEYRTQAMSTISTVSDSSYVWPAVPIVGDLLRYTVAPPFVWPCYRRYSGRFSHHVRYSRRLKANFQYARASPQTAEGGGGGKCVPHPNSSAIAIPVRCHQVPVQPVRRQL
jgi:hypothetical protein